jgi:arylsulfatase A-like enzyme
MNRYFHFLLLLTGLGCLSISCSNEQFPEKPNIVYIMADDLGYGDVGIHGQKIIKTPNLDRMASEGLRFTQHYSGSTVCAPSRCCLMTGLHTGHAAVRGNRPMRPEGQVPMPEGTVTVVGLLKEAGYVTGMFGKWGLGGPGSVTDPMNTGFDEFYGYNCQRHAHRFYTPYLWHNSAKDSFPENLDDNYVTYSQDLIIEHTLQFIRDHKDEAFFLYAPFTIPHAELQVPDEDRDPYMEMFEETVYQGGGSYRYQEFPKATFAGMVSRLDRDVGRMLDLIVELGIDHKTVVFFTSDNGPHKEGGADPEFFNSNGIYRGIKRDLYEGGIRMPFFAWNPGHIKPGVTDHMAAFWDFLPTACELAGVVAPSDIDGISYVSTLLNKKQDAHDYLYWEFHEQGGKQAIRKGDWKAVKLQVSRQHSPGIELYNLAEDPGEETNLADQHPEIIEEMEEIFKSARTEDPDWPLLLEEKNLQQNEDNLP